MFGKERGDPIPESTELGSLLPPEWKGIDKKQVAKPFVALPTGRGTKYL